MRNQLNEKHFERIQELEDKRAKIFKDEKRLAKLRKGGPEKKKELKILELKMNEQKQNGQCRNSIDEEQKSVHEAYQSLLSEYHARSAYREKHVTTETLRKVEEESVIKLPIQLLISE